MLKIGKPTGLSHIGGTFTNRRAASALSDQDSALFRRDADARDTRIARLDDDEILAAAECVRVCCLGFHSDTLRADCLGEAGSCAHLERRDGRAAADGDGHAVRASEHGGCIALFIMMQIGPGVVERPPFQGRVVSQIVDGAVHGFRSSRQEPVIGNDVRVCLHAQMAFGIVLLDCVSGAVPSVGQPRVHRSGPRRVGRAVVQRAERQGQAVLV